MIDKQKNSTVMQFCIAILAVCCFCAACTDKNTESEPAAALYHEEPPVADEGGNIQVMQHDIEVENDTPGTIYVNGAALYIQNDDGKMKWKAAASLGDQAIYLGEKKEAVRTDGQKRMFFHIRLKDTDYWIQDYCYEPNTVPAFVSAERTLIYKSDTAAGATDEMLPELFIVAVDRKSIEETSDQRFVKIAAYCPDLTSSWLVKDKYVKRDKIELDAVSVEAMILAHVASESRNDIIRSELFQNAIEMGTPYSGRIEELQKLTEQIVAEEDYLKSLTVEKIDEKGIAADEVMLVSVPSYQAARELCSLPARTSVTVSKKTKMEDDTVWYFVQHKQMKGWVIENAITLK